jgi:hypothetical protein
LGEGAGDSLDALVLAAKTEIVSFLALSILVA